MTLRQVRSRLQGHPSSAPAPVEYGGIDDCYVESGKPGDLLQKYGMTAQQIVAAAERALARK